MAVVASSITLRLLWLGLLAAGALAQDADSLTVLTGTHSVQATEAATPTGSYLSLSSQITLASTGLPSLLSSVAANGTSTPASSASANVTLLTGSVQTTSSSSSSSSSAASLAGNATSGTSTSTASSASPINTQPCNNYAEFCDRKYSNITMVAAHNSPFVRPGSAAANQQYDVTSQLDDGVRFLQAQIQWPASANASSEPHFCHTSCDLLDAGPISAWLGRVRDWVAAHPYDVVTVLLGNGNYSKPALYAPYIAASGLLQYAYTPPLFPMALDDWPTLGAMILRGRRVVLFLDYEADEPAYPWLLDQFSQVWETPFDPTNTSFPCTVQRPPGLGAEQARDRLYLMNHNLNAEVRLLGADVLVPAVSLLNTTNGVEGPGSLGQAAADCRTAWGRAPNFLNVDYYNYGGFPGSVFEVAARMNGVSYNRTCCGPAASRAAGAVRMSAGVLGGCLGVVLLLLLS